MIVKEGWILKRGEHIKNWRARYFVLLDDGSLLGFKHQPPPGQYKDPTNDFTVKNCHIVKIESPTHFPFVIRGLNRDQEIERNFSAGNDQDRDSWCNAIMETSIRLQQLESMHNATHLTAPSHAQIHQHHHHIASQAQSPISSQLHQQQQQQHQSTTTHPQFLQHNPAALTTSAQQIMDSNMQSDRLNQMLYGGTEAPSATSSASSSFMDTTTTTTTTTTATNTTGASAVQNGSNNTNSNHQQQAMSVSPFNFGNSLPLRGPGAGCKLDYVPPKKMTLTDFHLIRLIGRGSWGKVMLSREKTSNELYAIKILKKHVIIEQKEVNHTLTESRILRTTNHPFLISLKYSFRDSGRLCFVMEFAGGGELFYHLSQEKKFSEDKTRFYGAEIVSALGYLHQHDVIYRDVKLENLLLGSDGHIKIADFGLCKDNIRLNDRTQTFCGTPEYLSPEVLEANQYNRAVDWWSLGVLLYEMMCGSLPFNNRTTDLLFREILLKQVTFPATLSEPAKHFLNGLLIKDPAKRLGGGQDDAGEIMMHPFFRGLNWQDLIEKKIPPPFVPDMTSDTDTKYFDRLFTGAPVNLTPIDGPNTNHLGEVDGSFFTQFSFAAGSILGQN